VHRVQRTKLKTSNFVGRSELMNYKKRPKTALHALLITTVLTLGLIQKTLNFLEGGRQIVMREAIQVMSNT